MLLNKRNRELASASGGAGAVKLNEGYQESGYSSGGDVSSGMSGGFSADSKETYEAAKSEPLQLKMPSLSSADSMEINNVNEISADSRAIAMELRKLDAKINSIAVWAKSFYSHFSQVIEKVNEISGKLDENQRKSDNMFKDVEDLKKRAEVFIGTEELLKLNDEIKSNLDKIVNSSGILGDRRKDIPIDLLEKTAILAKQNNEAIGAFTFEDYEEKIDSILKVVEESAEQISELKERVESCEEKSEDFKPIYKKGENKRKDKKESEKTYEEFLENMEEVPELPKLNSQKTKKTKRLKKDK